MAELREDCRESRQMAPGTEATTRGASLYAQRCSASPHCKRGKANISEYTLFARLCGKALMCIISPNPHNSPRSLTPILWMETWRHRVFKNFKQRGFSFVGEARL